MSGGGTTTTPGDDLQAAVVPRRRWVGPLLAVAGLALVPWAIYMAVSLPEAHAQSKFYDVAWVGFDLALAALLVATGVGLLRRSLWVQGTASAAAALLLCDAWFDVLGAGDREERLLAIVMAVAAELPLAAVCVLIARDAAGASEQAWRYALEARRRLPHRRADTSKPSSG